MIKLNLGSHNKEIGPDWINIDGLDLVRVDGVCDLSITPFAIHSRNDEKFKLFNRDKSNIIGIDDSVVDEINLTEVLEHISFRRTFEVLNECYRILKRGGKLRIEVPDCGKAMEYYVNNEICECVKQKAVKRNRTENFTSNEKCFNCGGKAKIHPIRWLQSFLGAQKHKYDSHLNMFTKERLEKALKDVGFTTITFDNNEYKLRVTIYK